MTNLLQLRKEIESSINIADKRRMDIIRAQLEAKKAAQERLLMIHKLFLKEGAQS